MAPTVPTYIPDELTAGETWKFTLSYGDFPAGDGWAFAIYFRGASILNALSTGDTPTITADGDAFAVVIPAADTASLTAGTYEWIARATLDGETYLADSGSLRVLPNLATATAGARQSHNEKMLAAYEAEIAARVSGAGTAHNSHTILGRSIEFVPLAELEAERRKYAAAVMRERRGGRLPDRLAGFVRP